MVKQTGVKHNLGVQVRLLPSPPQPLMWWLWWPVCVMKALVMTAHACQSKTYCLYRQSALLNGNQGHQHHLCTLLHTTVYLTCINFSPNVSIHENITLQYSCFNLLDHIIYLPCYLHFFHHWLFLNKLLPLTPRDIPDVDDTVYIKQSQR